MASFSPSYPSVTVREIDLTTHVSIGDLTSFGGVVINSTWGPCEEVTVVTNEVELVSVFDKPNEDNYIDFFSAAGFLDYSRALNVVRACDSSARNSVAGNTAVQIKNMDDYDNATLTNTGAWISRYPGEKGNSLFIACCDSTVDLTANVNPNSNSFGIWSNYFTTIPGTSTHADNMGGSLDEIHIIIIDEDGKFTGTSGTVLEKYEYLSKASGSKKEDGTNNYYKDVINKTSGYVMVGGSYVLGANSTGTISTTWSATGNNAVSLTGGVDVSSSNTAMYINAYNLFADKKSIDVSHIIAGNVNSVILQNIIDMAEDRGDCVVFCSPEWTDVQPGQTQSVIASNIIDYKTNSIVTSSSYYFMDGNWKQRYDKYNDVNRWIPCNSDCAGLKAKAEIENDMWWNGSGYNRGLIKNCIKLAWNPQDTYMGLIYKKNVNPVISDGGAFVLLGDKTGLIKPSAFDRINVRYLFNVLKKRIADYLKHGLFEFNDEFTREQLKSQVETFLTFIKGRRGIEDFFVICDLNNNTGIVRQNNQLVMTILIKPLYSINFILLNMVATGASVEFSEVIGKI